MDITVTYRIENDFLPELTRKLPDLVSDAIGKLTYQTQLEARLNCPVDTGALRNSIDTEVDRMAGFVFTGLDYAGYVEFGTYKMAARPYMGRAAEWAEAELDKVAAGIAEALA